MPELNFDGTLGRNNKVCGHEPVVNLRWNHTGETYYESLKAEISTEEQIWTLKVLSITVQEEICNRTNLSYLLTNLNVRKSRNWLDGIMFSIGAGQSKDHM